MTSSGPARVQFLDKINLSDRWAHSKSAQDSHLEVCAPSVRNDSACTCKLTGSKVPQMSILPAERSDDRRAATPSKNYELVAACTRMMPPMALVETTIHNPGGVFLAIASGCAPFRQGQRSLESRSVALKVSGEGGPAFCFLPPTPRANTDIRWPISSLQSPGFAALRARASGPPPAQLSLAGTRGAAVRRMISTSEQLRVQES